MGRALHSSWSRPNFIKAPATVAASCRRGPREAPETGGGRRFSAGTRSGTQSPVLEAWGVEPDCGGLNHTVVSIFVVSLANGMTALPATPRVAERIERVGAQYQAHSEYSSVFIAVTCNEVFRTLLLAGVFQIIKMTLEFNCYV